MISLWSFTLSSINNFVLEQWQSEEHKQNYKNEANKEEYKNEKKKSLRNAGDIINRLKWDTQFDSSRVLIGYLDRFDGIQEIDIEEYCAGDIPQHRIYYFKYEDEIIWDRRSKLDLITGKDVSRFSQM